MKEVKKANSWAFYLKIAGEMEMVRKSIKWENVIPRSRFFLGFFVGSMGFVVK